MGGWLKQLTAVTIKFGPFLDSADGVTEETGLTINQADIRLSKNGGNITQSNNTAGATHDELGYYDVPLDVIDTNTLGALTLAIHKSGALPVRDTFMVVPANVWDSLFGAAKLQTDLSQVRGDVQSALDLKAFVDAGYDPATNKVQGVVLADTVTNDVGISQAGADKVWNSAARTLTSFGTLVSDIWAAAARTLTAGTKDAEVDRLLGLAKEYFFLDTIVHGQYGPTSARKRIYSNSASVGTDNDVIATYTVTYIYSSGQLVSEKQVKQ